MSNFNNFLMTFSKGQVSSSSNFASFFSVMTLNSTILFWLKLASAHIKSPQIIYVSFGLRVSFSSNFASLFSVMRHNSSLLFHLKLYMLWTKGAHQCCDFQTFDCLHENQPNSLSFFKPRVSFSLNFASPFSVMTHNSCEIFSLKHFFKISRFLSALMKVHPISNAIFETTRSGFIQILHHCPVSWKITPLHFLAQTSCALDKNSHQSKISGLLSGCVKIHQIPHFIIEITTFHHSSMS